MKKLAATIVVALAVAAATQFLSSASSSAFAETIPSGAIYMIDGDTADINGKRYRLVGYDTPETYRAECDFERAWGNQATERARQLIGEAGAIELVVLPGEDRYGRGLARIMINGADLGRILISENLARPYDGGRRAGWCG